LLQINKFNKDYKNKNFRCKKVQARRKILRKVKNSKTTKNCNKFLEKNARKFKNHKKCKNCNKFVEKNARNRKITKKNEKMQDK